MNETNKNQISKLEKMKAFVEIAIFKKNQDANFQFTLKVLNTLAAAHSHCEHHLWLWFEQELLSNDSGWSEMKRPACPHQWKSFCPSQL